ncbi:MAG: stage III sporulation protein AF [Clostridiales bacterium]|nr:stage III sporulation protein AF [Clostridiales bacterium]
MEDIWGYIKKIIFFLFMISIIMECVKGMKCEKYIRSVLSVMFILIVVNPLEAFVQEDFIDNAIGYFTNEMEQSSRNAQMETADDAAKELLRKETVQQIQEKIIDLAESCEIIIKEADPVVLYTSQDSLQIDTIRITGTYFGEKELERVEQQFRETVAKQFGLEPDRMNISLKGGEAS